MSAWDYQWWTWSCPWIRWTRSCSKCPKMTKNSLAMKMLNRSSKSLTKWPTLAMNAIVKEKEISLLFIRFLEVLASPWQIFLALGFYLLRGMCLSSKTKTQFMPIVGVVEAKEEVWWSRPTTQESRMLTMWPIPQTIQNQAKDSLQVFLLGTLYWIWAKVMLRLELLPLIFKIRRHRIRMLMGISHHCKMRLQKIMHHKGRTLLTKKILMHSQWKITTQ